jgi:CRP-like cAMP-binding protein
MELDSTAKVELVSKVPLFEGCSTEELRGIVDVAETKEFPAGLDLIKEGEQQAREFFVIIKGAAVIARSGRKIGDLGEGGYFGEIQLLADTPRLATVRTVTPLTALVVNEKSFRQALSDHPTIAVKLVYHLADMVAYYARQGA